MSLLGFLPKTGAIISTAGIAMFIAFVLVLLIFPVIKKCASISPVNCSYLSSAPAYLQPLFSPGFLAISLIVIAIGILMIRLGTRLAAKKTEDV